MVNVRDERLLHYLANVRDKKVVMSGIYIIPTAFDYLRLNQLCSLFWLDATVTRAVPLFVYR